MSEAERIEAWYAQSRGLPGADLIAEGLRQLACGRRGPEAWLVLVATQRLRQAGVPVPHVEAATEPELALYDRVAETGGAGAHAAYNAWIGRLGRFLRAVASD